MVAASAATWGAGVDVVAALGHGRSYGADSCFLGRTITGILDCGLWRHLAASPGVATRALDVDTRIAFGQACAIGSSCVTPSTPPLLGYCDRLSVRPGDRIRFHVGAREGEVPYRADVVRLRCVDVQPGGAAFHEQAIASDVAGARVARVERVDRGSRAIVPVVCLVNEMARE